MLICRDVRRADRERGEMGAYAVVGDHGETHVRGLRGRDDYLALGLEQFRDGGAVRCGSADSPRDDSD